jgi:pyruvate dehydrogenase E2 component (dihydrolipoamide acetyltransferase)
MFEFKLPDLGEGVAEGEVLTWHVSPGDAVTEDQVLAEVETDKAAVDVPSPVDGVVQALHAEVGEMVQTGEVLITIEEAGEAEASEAEAGGAEPAEPAQTDSTATDAAESDGSAQADTSTADGRVFAPPSVRRLAREKGVDIAAIDGSGPSGRITEADVEAATAAVGEADGNDGDDGPTSVVSRVSDDGDGPTAVVSRVDDTDDTDDGTAVKSAVRSVSGDGQQAERRDQTLATPATRKVARELDVDIDAIPTDQTRDGQPYVDEAAVRTYAETQQAAQAADAEAVSAEGGAASATATEAGDAADAAAGGAEAEPTAVETSEGEWREPYRGVRRSIGEQMARSRREVPHATHHDRVVVSGLVEARERLEPLAEERGVDLTYTPFVVKCVAAALDQHPILNTALDTENEEIVYREAHNIGVATATDHGLVVPVVDDVDGKGLLELAGEINDLVGRARERDIERSEMQGGTFTVTNFGAIGGEYASPIINVPETAVLGIGALKERPVAEDGEVVAKPTLPLSLAIDHRVIDGADAARFVNTLKEYLADPTRLLLE